MYNIIICIHLYIAAGIYALYVRSMGWFWRVTVGGGGDRTQWFCVCLCVCDVHACICVRRYSCTTGTVSSPSQKAFSPAKSSWEIVSGTTLTHPFAPCTLIYRHCYPSTRRNPHAHYIIINIGLNLLCTHTRT